MDGLLCSILMALVMPFTLSLQVVKLKADLVWFLLLFATSPAGVQALER
jgi:hypothetical protein